MSFAQVCEIINIKVFLSMNIVMKNRLQFTCNYCTRVTRGVVPIVSVCQQFQSDYTLNQTVTYHIQALIRSYQFFLSHKIVELKAVSLFANALFL